MRTNGMKLYRLEWYDGESSQLIFTNRKTAIDTYEKKRCEEACCCIVEMYKASDDTMRDGQIVEEYIENAIYQLN